MIFDIIQPSPTYAKYIHHYQYTLIDSAESHFVSYLRSVKPLPNGYLEMFFNFNGDDVQLNASNYHFTKATIFFVGLHDLYYKTHMASLSAVHSFAITFNPLGFYQLFGIRESELFNNVIDGECIKKHFKFIYEKLCGLENVEKMRDVFENNVTSFIPACCEVRHLVSILEYARYKHGLTCINEIVERFNINRRKLERLFSAHLGISPYHYLKILRFNYTLKRIALGHSVIDAAIECGYYDQAHFIKDFKHIIGYSPANYLSKIPNEYYNFTVTNRIYMPQPISNDL